jgi:hypothetical protein
MKLRSRFAHGASQAFAAVPNMARQCNSYRFLSLCLEVMHASVSHGRLVIYEEFFMKKLAF